MTKRGFGEMSLEQQRNRLITGLGGIAAQTGAEVTVVFDGAERVHGPAAGAARRAGAVLPQGRDRRRADPPAGPGRAAGRPVVVVSSDREVADGVRRHGAYPMGADSCCAAARARPAA